MGYIGIIINILILNLVASFPHTVRSIAETERIPLNERANFPDPVKFDQNLRNHEIGKRDDIQEQSTPSFNDLLESFGGPNPKEVANLEPNNVRNLNTNSVESETDNQGSFRTGVYYLIDWNTFFDIDDQKGKRVNLRFQPKIGDPNLFFSV